MFMMPMTFATEEFEEFVTVLNTYLEQIKVQGLTERKAKIEMMCAFYTSLLARMTAAIKTTKFEHSLKKHYKYDLRACKEAHEELMTTEAYKEYEDQRVFKPAWGHLDGYVWGILYKCYTLLTHANIHMKKNNTFLHNWHIFLDQSTKQLNDMKKKTERYILSIESRSRNIDIEHLGALWHLQTLITFKEGSNGLPSEVYSRDWYIEPFSYDLPTPAGRQEGGSYMTFANPRRRNPGAHITCDNIGGLLARIQKL